MRVIYQKAGRLLIAPDPQAVHEKVRPSNYKSELRDMGEGHFQLGKTTEKGAFVPFSPPELASYGLDVVDLESVSQAFVAFGLDDLVVSILERCVEPLGTMLAIKLYEEATA